MMAMFMGNQRVQKICYKMNIKFEDYRNYLENNKLILTLQQSFKSEAHNLYTEKGNKFALSSNNVKSLQTLNEVSSYPHGMSAGKVCK